MIKYSIEHIKEYDNLFINEFIDGYLKDLLNNNDNDPYYSDCDYINQNNSLITFHNIIESEDIEWILYNLLDRGIINWFTKK